MTGAAAAGASQPASVNPSPTQQPPPPLPPSLPPHLVSYLTSPAVTAFLSSLAPHFPSYTPQQLSSLFATLLAARHRSSPHCTSQQQWTAKYAPTSVDHLWSLAPQTATLQHFAHSLAAQQTAGAAPSLLLVGPSSSSKTAAAYAIAHTLQAGVIEVHAGMARSGKDVQTFVGEATQSHRLHGDRRDLWQVDKEERWRSWEKSQQQKQKKQKEEQREPDEQHDTHDDDDSEDVTLSAQRTKRTKRPSSAAANTPRRRRKQQPQSEGEHSEADAHIDGSEAVPERLVIRLKMRSNNRARLLSCPAVPAQPQPATVSSGKRKKEGSIASFFSQPAAAKQPVEQADDGDEAVIERGVEEEGGAEEASSAGKRKGGKAKRGSKQKPKGIGDFFATKTAHSEEASEVAEEERKDVPAVDAPAEVEVEAEREEAVVKRKKKEQTGGSGSKKRKKGKQKAAGTLGAFFAGPVLPANLADDDIEEETKEERPAAAAAEDGEKVQPAASEAVRLDEAQPERQHADDSTKRKVQKGIGGFFGGKSETIVLDATTNGKRKGKKTKTAAAIDLTSPPPTSRNRPATPPSPIRPPSPPPHSAAASASAAAGSSKQSSSLILFEDVDLVFPSDVKFPAKLRSLVLTAKRPLLLTAQCVPDWVDEVSDDKLRIVTMSRLGSEECILYATLICAVETGADASHGGGSGSKGWSCADVARLCRWWQFDVRRVLMTLQVLVGIRDTDSFSSEAPVDTTLLSSPADGSLLALPPLVTADSSLLLPPVGLSCVSSALLSTFAALQPSTFALLCSASSAVDVTHLNWASAAQRRASALLRGLPMAEVVTAVSVDEMVSVADVPADCVRVIVAYSTHDSALPAADAQPLVTPEVATQSVAAIEPSQSAQTEALPQPLPAGNASASQADDDVELVSSRRVNGRRKVIAEDDGDEEGCDADHAMHDDSDRLDSDVILVDPPTVTTDPAQQQAAFTLHLRQLACAQLKERECAHRLAYAASCVPSPAQQLACRYVESMAAFASLLCDSNVLSCARLLPLSSTVPSSLLYLRHPSLPPQYIDVNVPYSGTSYRCADWWLTGERDGLRGEMDEDRRDEQPMCEEMFAEVRAQMEALGLTEVRRAVEEMEAIVTSTSPDTLYRRQEGDVPPPRRTPLGRQSAVIEVVVSAETLPADVILPALSVPPPQPIEAVAPVDTVSRDASLPAFSSSAEAPFALSLAPPLPPTMSSPAARLSSIHASRELFSSLRCKLHAPSSRTWLTDIYPFLCHMGVVEGQREDERRIEAQRAAEERDRLAAESRARRQAQREARQLKRKERKHARKEKRRNRSKRRVDRQLTSTTSSDESSSARSSAAECSDDDSSSSHTSGGSLLLDSDDDDSSATLDFFAPRRAGRRRGRRRHASSQRLVVEEGRGREEMHVCGGLEGALYEEVMAALRLPRWRDWSDE